MKRVQKASEVRNAEHGIMRGGYIVIVTPRNTKMLADGVLLNISAKPT